VATEKHQQRADQRSTASPEALAVEPWILDPRSDTAAEAAAVPIELISDRESGRSREPGGRQGQKSESEDADPPPSAPPWSWWDRDVARRADAVNTKRSLCLHRRTRGGQWHVAAGSLPGSPRGVDYISDPHLTMWCWKGIYFCISLCLTLPTAWLSERPAGAIR